MLKVLLMLLITLVLSCISHVCTGANKQPKLLINNSELTLTLIF